MSIYFCHSGIFEAGDCSGTLNIHRSSDYLSLFMLPSCPWHQRSWTRSARKFKENHREIKSDCHLGRPRHCLYGNREQDCITRRGSDVIVPVMAKSTCTYWLRWLPVGAEKFDIPAKPALERPGRALKLSKIFFPSSWMPSTLLQQPHTEPEPYSPGMKYHPITLALSLAIPYRVHFLCLDSRD